ncbi:hypothetical protein IE077_000932 [Cardiosporidium cionae]|uniref:Uncharacterized protein n=1 Tax=Cardiosporidium cionae TaxID=476202 RepID=A0ABQ7J6E6_9APIC|nr:hypothetical protein IE077_000932 [Cardiosporidium cionae]|eukprot:KAF8819494.1 hypothetical protein IE077_000932 [Cardiosporidium cionae]
MMQKQISKRCGTSLHIAADRGHKEVMECLIGNRVNINVVDNYGNTFLHVAAILGSKEVVECLIKNGANINAINLKGNTPLREASSK